ncbi:FHA domain-containing protein [Rhodococcus sp. NPDC056960]|uniref:FHA domain-containing protein n=1 Tax=Rhodococcus sp. NPDC056960 TaxID=3345982 RepID=UPI00364028F3
MRNAVDATGMFEHLPRLIHIPHGVLKPILIEVATMNLTDDLPRTHLPGDRGDGAPQLVVTRGPGQTKGASLAVDRDITVLGSHPRSEIVLGHGTVSRRHAEIRRDGAQFILCDVGSLNGTYLNRQPVDCAGLVDGDEVRIGVFRLLFRLPAAS